MADETWLDLLVREANQAELAEYQRRLARELGAEPAAEQAAAAGRIRTLLDQRRQRAGELATLNDIAAHLTATDERGLDSLLNDIAVHARRLLVVDMAYIGLLDPDQWLSMRAVTGALTPRLRGHRIPADSGLAGEVLRRVEPVWTDDYPNAPFFHRPEADEVAAAEQSQSVLAVPLSGRDKLLGALFVTERRRRRFTNEDVALLVALAAHAAVAVDNQQLVERLASANTALRERTEDLERALRWDTILTEVVLRGGDAEDLLTEVGAHAGRPVRLVTQEGPAPAGMPEELVASVRGVLGETDASAAVEPPAVAVGEHRLVVRPVVAGRRLLGALVADEDPPDPGLRRLLERAAPALALTLVGAEAVIAAGRRATDLFFADLVNNPSADPTELARQTRLAGLAGNQAYQVLVAGRTGERSPAPALRLDAPQGAVVADLGSRVAVALPVHHGGTADQVRQRWSARLAGTTAGLSGPCLGGERIAQGYREASQVADALAALDRTGEIATADELGVYGVLLGEVSRAAVRAAIKKGLGPLLAEQARGVPLLATAEAYFANSQRPGATAGALSVHVNTVYQRLATIDRLLGPDWRTEPRRFDLQLLLRLHRASRALGHD